jgi:hypothetical protein
MRGTTRGACRKCGATPVPNEGIHLYLDNLVIARRLARCWLPARTRPSRHSAPKCGRRFHP